jgi:hypothetical protein
LRTLIILIVLVTNSLGADTSSISLIQVSAGVRASSVIRGGKFLRQCAGQLGHEVDLSAIGLSPADLKMGIDCLALDFDKNGDTDYLFYPKLDAKFNNALVLFYKGNKVDRTQVLKGTNFEPFLEMDSKRRDYPQYKGQFGLIKPFEGDEAWVYFYNSKSRLFERAKYVYPPDHEYD